MIVRHSLSLTGCDHFKAGICFASLCPEGKLSCCVYCLETCERLCEEAAYALGKRKLKVQQVQQARKVSRIKQPKSRSQRPKRKRNY